MVAASSPHPSPRDYRAESATRDGEPFRIRAIRPGDKERLREAFHSLSRESVYFRFFEIKSKLSEAELRYLTEVDFESHVGLVAVFGPPEDETGAGIARYVVEPGSNPVRAEAAFAVLDVHQGRGIGTQLLYHLADVARGAGVQVFTGEVLGENLKMMEVFFHSGFDVHRNVESGVIHVEFSIEEGAGGPPRAHGLVPPGRTP